ncbi:imm11 family protein [Sphingomonas lenta]|uniref:Immunity MXAN-0049 protein domain-containing protein n=1 Tax=Sphingomonas lenta TaxID=1141887 RepID=A0A2A2SFA3_9SPHN|nr:DUF1629 domain-containing protein [Sphingomonas lenta]PAX07885.1 hypothetical protein CKY28_09745 [Sphingomonas lenta]
MIDPDRIIRIEGEGLLPPAYEPQIPAGMREDEKVRVIPPCPPWRSQTAAELVDVFHGRSPQDQRYWFFREAYESKLPDGMTWEGDPGPGQPHFGSGCGLDRVPDNSVFRFHTSTARIKMPDLWNYRGMLVMSGRLLELFREVDADALVWKRLLIRGKDGGTVPGDFYLVDVVRNIPAIDIANSIVEYRGPSGPYPPALVGYVSCRVRDDLDPSLHVFRQTKFGLSGGYRVIVSAALRRRLLDIKPSLTNMHFTACGDL